MAKRTPPVAGSPIQRAISTRLKWPCPTSTTSPPASAARASASTASARAPTCAAVSPPGQGCVHTVQPGTSRGSPAW